MRIRGQCEVHCIRLSVRNWNRAFKRSLEDSAIRRAKKEGRAGGELGSSRSMPGHAAHSGITCVGIVFKQIGGAARRRRGATAQQGKRQDGANNDEPGIVRAQRVQFFLVWYDQSVQVLFWFHRFFGSSVTCGRVEKNQAHADEVPQNPEGESGLRRSSGNSPSAV